MAPDERAPVRGDSAGAPAEAVAGVAGEPLGRVAREVLGRLNALSLGELSRLHLALDEARATLGGVGQSDLADRLALAQRSLRAGDTKEFRRAISNVTARLGHLK